MIVLEIVGQVLIVVGALIFATAALGLLRFFDAFSRISAVGTAGGLGISFVVVGALLLQPTVSDTVKVALILVFQFATSAIGTMAIARSAYLVGTPLERAGYEELAEDSVNDTAAGVPNRRGCAADHTPTATPHSHD